MSDLLVNTTKPLQLDAEDESLARWKASLGLTGAVNADTNGPKVCFFNLHQHNTTNHRGNNQVTVLSLELTSPTMPPGKKLVFDLKNQNQAKKDLFTIKEGVEYKFA
jgi:Rho GDP-dissociation inhibitor